MSETIPEAKPRPVKSAVPRDVCCVGACVTLRKGIRNECLRCGRYHLFRQKMREGTFGPMTRTVPPHNVGGDTCIHRFEGLEITYRRLLRQRRL